MIKNGSEKVERVRVLLVSGKKNTVYTDKRMRLVNKREDGKIVNYIRKIDRIEDVVMLWFNVKILKFWSVLIDDNWRQYFSYVPFFLLNLSQLLDLYYTQKELKDKIHDIYMTMLMFNTFLRGINMVTNRQKFSRLFEYIKSLYAELVTERDLEIRQILQQHSEMSLKFSKANLSIGILTLMGFSIIPLLSERKEFIFGLYAPYFDEYQSPWYEIIFAAQSVLNFSGMCIFIPFTGLFVSFFIFAIAISKVLQYKLSFIEKVNELSSMVALIDFILFIIVLCIMLLSLILVKAVIQKCIILGYLLMMLTQITLLYYFSNEVYYQSLEISTAVYDTDWFKYDIATQTVLKLLLLRSQKPCAILMDNAYPINLRRLLVLLKITYSVFTLLEQLYG
ncbi:odorant receptor 30a-like [Musca autumnalis]|uniref:odorant receptor 30a-like n=1 Tax=Musca autumnalis TaxID=221902 RepID=UPI003CED9CA5